MCGRYTLTRQEKELRRELGLAAVPAYAPRFNIAPTQESLIVRPLAGGGRRCEIATWGFSGGRRLLINARSETVAEKPSFRDSFARRRCLVPADGFYEWRRERGRRRPFYFTGVRGELLTFGGLWKQERDADEEVRRVFTILTVPANELVARVHPRMPLLLPSAAWGPWLDERADHGVLAALLAPSPASEMTSREVSTAVNDVGCDSPACLAPPEPPSAVQLDLLT